MKALRTPDERFADLPDYPFAPRYADVDGLRMHYIDEGDGPVVILLHGEPSWSFLYRHFVPTLVEAGHRVVAPDLVGFGKSDKPVDDAAYTYASHEQWLRGLLFGELGLEDIHMFCQDWGGLLGLRIAGLDPDRFTGIVAANTFLAAGRTMPKAFEQWRAFVQRTPDLPVEMILQGATQRTLTDAEIAAYAAPFPDVTYKGGVRTFPLLVPDGPDAPGVARNLEAWAGLKAFDRPFLTCFSDGDPITAGADRILQAKIPGAADQKHRTVPGGHFLQEDSPAEQVAAIRELTGR